MKIIDGRGFSKKIEGEKNLEIIREWFINNPLGFQKDCAKELGLSLPTVSKYVTIIRNETKEG